MGKRMLCINRYVFLFTVLVLMLNGCTNNKKRLNSGDTAPDFELPSLSGQTVKLQDYHGKIVLLHFWADWCSDCRAEFPKLEAAYRKFQNQNFEIIAVNVSQSVEHVSSFKDEFKLTFPMLMDEKSSVAETYGIRGLPTNYFIGPDGSVKKVIIGWVAEQQIENVLKSLETMR